MKLSKLNEDHKDKIDEIKGNGILNGIVLLFLFMVYAYKIYIPILGHVPNRFNSLLT